MRVGSLRCTFLALVKSSYCPANLVAPSYLYTPSPACLMPLARFTYYSWLVVLGICWGTCQRAAGQQALPKRLVVASKLPNVRRPTLFPDTLHAHLLDVTYWSRRQVDSLQAVLGTARWQLNRMLVDSTARSRVFLGEYDRALRLFYCPLATPTKWVEFDLRPWAAYEDLDYLHAYVVQLDQRGPEELLVKMGSGEHGAGYNATAVQTLLLSLDGPPRLLWQSIDERLEEQAPIREKDKEDVGGNSAYCQRTVAMRKGLVYVSQVQKEGKFEDPDLQLTPIAPGYYQYQHGRFRRVTPPKSLPNPKRFHPPK
jgi:hypothetical protein